MTWPDLDLGSTGGPGELLITQAWEMEGTSSMLEAVGTPRPGDGSLFPPILPSLSGFWFWDGPSQEVQETESPKPLPRGAQEEEESPYPQTGLGASPGSSPRLPWRWALRNPSTTQHTPKGQPRPLSSHQTSMYHTNLSMSNLGLCGFF